MTPLARVEAADRDGVRVISVSGEVDLSNAREVMDAIAALVPHDASSVVLDLSDAGYLDSAGVAMLFRLGERLRYSRQDLRLVVPVDAPISAVVKLTNMEHVIPVVETLDETPRP